MDISQVEPGTNAAIDDVPETSEGASAESEGKSPLESEDKSPPTQAEIQARMDQWLDEQLRQAKKVAEAHYSMLKSDIEYQGLNVQKRFEHFYTHFPLFTKNYPIVVRLLTGYNQYHPKAFVRFIRKLVTKHYQSREEYYERQADYAKYLYMSLTPHCSPKEANRVWRHTYETLRKESETFEKDYKDAEDQVKSKKQEDLDKLKLELKKQLEEMPEHTKLLIKKRLIKKNIMNTLTSAQEEETKLIKELKNLESHINDLTAIQLPAEIKDYNNASENDKGKYADNIHAIENDLEETESSYNKKKISLDENRRIREKYTQLLETLKQQMGDDFYKIDSAQIFTSSKPKTEVEPYYVVVESDDESDGEPEGEPDDE